MTIDLPTRPSYTEPSPTTYRAIRYVAPTRSFDGHALALGDAIVALAAIFIAGRGEPAAFALSAALLAAYALSGDYRRPRLSLSALKELPRIVAHAAVPFVATSILAARDVQTAPSALRFSVVLLIAIVSGRMLSYALLRELRKRGVRSHATVVIGAGETATRLSRLLDEHAEFGLSTVATIDEAPGATVTHLEGQLADLPRLMTEKGVSRVVLGYGMWNDARIVELIREVPGSDVEIYIVPRLFEAGGAAGDPLGEDLFGVPLVWLRRRATRRWQLRKKRIFDLAVTSFAGLLLMPVLLALAVAVKLSSPGPVLFRQRRIGRNGREFDVLKFRSMRVNSDSDTTWTVANDTRVTGIGKLIRRTSLDELPQLFNILKGEMSLVGPRPERPFYVEQFGKTIRGYHDRHRGPVGLTGLAQVNGLRGDTAIDDRVRVDNSYIDQWSMWGDIVILVRTFTAAFQGQ